MARGTCLHKLHVASLVPSQLFHVVKDTEERVAQIVDEGNLSPILEKDEYSVAS